MRTRTTARFRWERKKEMKHHVTLRNRLKLNRKQIKLNLPLKLFLN